MLHPADPHPSVDVRDRETDPGPIAIALAVLGPLALVIALAVFAAFAG
jgi:hypothetical protein